MVCTVPIYIFFIFLFKTKIFLYQPTLSRASVGRRAEHVI